MVCGGFACSRNALCALNVVYVVSGAGGAGEGPSGLGMGPARGNNPPSWDLGLGGPVPPPGGFGVPLLWRCWDPPDFRGWRGAVGFPLKG
uniref:Secreted protein n=1 Tax=Strix occidentalis caurina TaxID=311401 RepID=A0A8D0F9L2_STROC